MFFIKFDVFFIVVEIIQSDVEVEVCVLFFFYLFVYSLYKLKWKNMEIVNRVRWKLWYRRMLLTTALNYGRIERNFDLLVERF